MIATMDNGINCLFKNQSKEPLIVENKLPLNSLENKNVNKIENINKNITIDELSNIFFFDKFYIMKLFKKELNITIINYININWTCISIRIHSNWSCIN